MAVVRVINPNSNDAVTRGMDDAVAALRLTDGPPIDCVTMPEGPFGIESDNDAATVAPLVAKRIAEDDEAAAFVIACYSDPGLEAARAETDQPVFGMAECAILTAVTRGGGFGVISILDASIPRHMRHLEARGMTHFCAGDRAINMTVAESASGADTFRRLVDVGSTLRDTDDARCVILGCAGMAAHRAPLEAELGIPVIDPVQAATAMAVGAVCLAG